MLVVLRSLVTALILFILFEPLLNISWMFKQAPGVAVLVDNSASMSLKDADVQRCEIQKEIVSQLMGINRANGNKQHLFHFSDTFAEFDLKNIDSLKFSDDGTDIANALKEINSRIEDLDIRGIVLISDGNHNLGINPLHLLDAYATPIYTIGIGEKQGKYDVLITNIITNQVTYANSDVPVDINFRSIGFDGQKVTLSLMSGDTILDSRILNLESTSLEQKLTLNYRPDSPGEHKYMVKISQLPGELTYKNNSRQFYVNVLKDKLNVLLISGAPGYDHAFVKKILSSDQNISLSSLSLKNESEFYPHTLDLTDNGLATFDCFMFIDYPRSGTQATLVRKISDLIIHERKSLFLITGKHMDAKILGSLAEYLPFQIKSISRNELLVSVTPTVEAVMDPIIAGSEEGSDNNWHDLPPVYYPFNDVISRPNSHTYLKAHINNPDNRSSDRELPVLMTQTLNQIKVMALLGHGFWRWDFTMKGIDDEHNLFNQFISKSIRWLVTRDDSKLVKIYTNKPIYRSGETIYINAEVYSKNYTPLDEVDVRVTINGEDVLLNGLGSGKYQGEYRILTGGDYRYNGTAVYKNTILGEDDGRFSVEDYNLEYQQTDMNELLLQQISYMTNGQYFTPQDAAKLEQLLSYEQRELLKSNQFEIWNKTFILVAIILLLSTEWFIRKRKGML